MTLEEKCEQYRQLKRSKKVLEEKLAALKQDILPYFSNTLSAHGLELQIRDLTTYKEDEVYNLLHFKGVDIHAFTNHVVDPDKVAQLYYDGVLTDDDLRRIREPKTVYALIDRGDSSVQEEHDC